MKGNKEFTDEFEKVIAWFHVILLIAIGKKDETVPKPASKILDSAWKMELKHLLISHQQVIWFKTMNEIRSNYERIVNSYYNARQLGIHSGLVDVHGREHAAFALMKVSAASLTNIGGKSFQLDMAHLAKALYPRCRVKVVNYNLRVFGKTHALREKRTKYNEKYTITNDIAISKTFSSSNIHPALKANLLDTIWVSSGGDQISHLITVRDLLSYLEYDGVLFGKNDVTVMIAVREWMKTEFINKLSSHLMARPFRHLRPDEYYTSWSDLPSQIDFMADRVYVRISSASLVEMVRKLKRIVAKDKGFNGTQIRWDPDGVPTLWTSKVNLRMFGTINEQEEAENQAELTVGGQ